MLLFSLSFALSVGAQEVGLIFPWWILSALGWDVAIDCVGKLCKTRLLGRSWSCWLLHTFALEWNKCKSESQKLGGWPFFSNSISWYFMFSAVVAPSWWLWHLVTSGDIWWHLVTSGFIWWHLVTSGDIWWHLVTSGFIWFHLVSSDDIWFHLVSSGDIWWHLVTSGDIWWHLVTSGFIWFHLVTSGDIWWHLVSSGDIWWHLVTSGFIWWHLVTSGDIWWHLVTSGDIWWHLVTSGDIWFHLVSSGDIWYSGLHLHPWTWGSIVWSRRQRISRFFRSDPMSFFALRGKEVPFIPGEDLLRSLLGISLTQR